MLVEQAQSSERALWAALRSLEEKAALARRLEENAKSRNYTEVAERFAERAAESEHHAESVRRLLLQDRQVETSPESADMVEELDGK